MRPTDHVVMHALTLGAANGSNCLQELVEGVHFLCLLVADGSLFLQSFEHLLSMELVAPADAGPTGSRQLKEYRPMVLLLTDEQVLEGLQKYPNCPTEVAYWGSQTGMVR